MLLTARDPQTHTIQEVQSEKWRKILLAQPQPNKTAILADRIELRAESIDRDKN